VEFFWVNLHFTSVVKRGENDEADAKVEAGHIIFLRTHGDNANNA